MRRTAEDFFSLFFFSFVFFVGFLLHGRFVTARSRFAVSNYPTEWYPIGPGIKSFNYNILFHKSETDYRSPVISGSQILILSFYAPFVDFQKFVTSPPPSTIWLKKSMIRFFFFFFMVYFANKPYDMTEINFSFRINTNFTPRPLAYPRQCSRGVPRVRSRHCCNQVIWKSE